MTEATDKNPLIQDTPADTLNWCANVLAYLQLESIAKNPNELTDAQDAGRFMVLQCVEDALRFEGERVELKAELDDEGGHPFVIRGGRDDGR